MKQKWRDFLDMLALAYSDVDRLDQIIIAVAIACALALTVFSIDLIGGFR